MSVLICTGTDLIQEHIVGEKHLSDFPCLVSWCCSSCPDHFCSQPADVPTCADVAEMSGLKSAKGKTRA